METQGRLKRIPVDGAPEAVMMQGGSILFRHYTISLHAIDRFVERCDRPAADILPMLHNAVLACLERAKRAGIKRVIRVAQERGGYVLFYETCYFVVVPDPKTGSHVVTTVMTPRYMGKGYSSIRGNHE